MGYLTGMGRCYVCGQPFEFNPDRVPSVPIDPATGRPPDLGGDPAMARREPLCGDCVASINPRRRLLGLPEIEVLAGAYDAQEAES